MSQRVAKHRIFLIFLPVLLMAIVLFSMKFRGNPSIDSSSGKATDRLQSVGSAGDGPKITEPLQQPADESVVEAIPVAEMPGKSEIPETDSTDVVSRKQQHLIHRVISEKWIGEKAVNGQPARQRIRIVETDFKYPMLRLEENVTKDPKTGEEVSEIRSSSVADHLLVGVKEDVDVKEARKQLEADGYRIRSVEKDSFLLVELNQYENADDQVAAINRLLGVDEFVNFAEPDWLVQTSVTPNDPAFGSGNAWSYDNPGTIAGTLYDADIDAPDGWDQRNDASSVVVAVTDTGIRYTHEDLASNMWDDGSGVHGWDAYSEDTDPMDTNGHGTHVAGIIGARGNNGVGTTGVAWKVQLMALRFIGPNGGTTSDAIRVINFARLNGAHIINASWGGGGYSEGLANAIKACYAADIPVVTAAGNYSRNNDSIIHYPSGYHTPNVVAVASSDANDSLSFFSNYGNVFVDLAAPGADIWSCGIASDSDYRHLSGTSMAAPHVAGALALAKVRYPGESSADLITRLYTSVDTRPSLSGKVATGGRLNLYRLLADSSPSYLHDDFEKPYWFFGCYGYWCYSNARMTREADEDVFSPDTGQKSMWFRWTAPADGLVRFKGQASADVSVVAFEGVDRNSLKRITDNFKQRPTKASYLYFYAKAGRTYTFSVDSRSSTPQIMIGELVHHPMNDMWRDAINLGSTNRIEVTGNNCGATAESWEYVTPPAAGAGNGRSVWWKWTPNFSGDFTLSTQSSPIDTVLAVYTGTSPAALTEIASNDDRSQVDWTSEVSFSVVSGTTYYILVDSARGAWVGDIVLNGYVPGSLFILKQPESKLVRIGDTATIQVAAAGQNLRYQWEFNGVPIPGAVQPHYNILRITEEDFGDYRVRVSDISTTIVSNVATLSELQLSPQIIWQTNSRSVSLGSSVDLRVRATGTPPLLYKWFKNGIEIPGATSDQITLNNVDANAAANYTATVNNSSGFTTTDPIVLKVFSSPWDGWNYIIPIAQSGSVFSIIKHAGQWVAASRSPNSIRISTSTDGKNWDQSYIKPDGTANSLIGMHLTRGNGFWLCAADASGVANDVVYKSTDLINWQQYVLPLAAGESVSSGSQLVFHDGYFYLGVYNAIYRSSDGISWSLQQTPLGDKIRNGKIVSDGTRLVIPRDSTGKVYVLSNTGGSWQEVVVDSASSNWISSSYWKSGKFYVYLSNVRYESVDGLSWQASTTTPSPDIQRDASWIANIGSTAYAYVNNGAQLYASTDAGLTWKSYLNSVPEGMTLAASDGTQMIFGTDLGGLLATNNPLTATFPTKTFGDSFVGVGYEGGLFIAQFWKNTMISSDGERWSTYPSVRIDSDPFASPQPTVPSKIGNEYWQIGYPSSSNPFIPFYRGKLPSVVQIGQVSGSPNVALTSFCEGSQGIFAIHMNYLGQSGSLAKSIDQGSSWTPVTSPVGNTSQYSKVFYTGSHYFYDVYLGNTYASADLVSWIDLGPTTEIIFHENEYWVFNGTGLRRSQNLVDWTPLVSMPNPGIFNLISYKGALVGIQNSLVSYSYDGVNWVPMNLGFTVNDIAASGHVLLAGGSGGQLAYTGSAPEIAPTVSIREPFEDTSYLAGTEIPVKVDAHSPDKTGDPVVRLYYDGILQGQKSSPPYEFDLPVGSAAKHLIHVECQNGSGPLAYARKRIIVTNPPAINLFTGYDNNSSLSGETIYRKGIFISRSNTGIRTSTDGLNWNLASLPTSVGTPKLFVEGSDRILAYTTVPADTNAAVTLDGVNWFGVKLPAAPGNVIRYSHGYFWCITASTEINTGFMTSPDGINWTHRKFAASPGTLTDLYGNPFGTMIGRNSSYKLIRSTDGGRTWALIPEVNYANSFTSDGQRFYVSNYNGSQWVSGSSTDGTNWVWSSPNAKNYNMKLVNGTAFASDSAGKVFTLSYDGINWQTINHELFADTIAWGEDGFFYARGPNPSSGGFANLMRSQNGLDWYAWATWPVSWPTSEQVSTFASEAGLFVSTVSGGLWYLPYNAKTWTTLYAPAATSPIFMDVAKNGNALIAINNSKSLMRSINDGQSWSTVYSLTVQESSTHILTNIYALGGVWLAWSPGTRLLRSVDGLVFTDVTTATGSNNFKALAHNSNHFTAIRGDGAVVTSTDGLNWSQLAAAGSFPDDRALKLVHNGTGWRALSVKSTATSVLNYSSSATGETWTQVQVPGSYFSGTAVLATNGIGTIAGIDPTYKFSANGTTWINATGHFSTCATSDAFYRFGQFGNAGWLEKSTDGTTWTANRYFGSAFSRAKVIDNELYLFGSGGFTKYAKRDLSISNVVTTTSNYGVGATLTVSFVLTNEGIEPTAAGQTGTEVFLSTDGFFGNSDDQALGTALVTAPALQPGESATLQVQAVIPNLIRPGEYRAGIWFNRQGIIQETSSSNNFATSLIQHVRIPGFRLSASSVGNGVVAQDVGQRIFASGSRVSLTATSGKGARFTGWVGDAIGTESQVTILMNQDRNVQANFVSQVNLQLFTRGAGTITGAADEGLYLAGETASLQAVPSAGWVFTGWTGAATGSSTGASVLMDQPRYVTASFALPMQAWKETYFTPGELLDPSISGNDKDIDGDGLENWKEYLHGSNPRDSVSKGILETKAEGGYLTMIFTRLAGTEGTYGLTCQGSRNLSDWNAPDLEIRVLDTVNGVETVEARITQNGQPKGFMRFGYQQ